MQAESLQWNRSSIDVLILMPGEEKEEAIGVERQCSLSCLALLGGLSPSMLLAGPESRHPALRFVMDPVECAYALCIFVRALTAFVNMRIFIRKQFFGVFDTVLRAREFSW